MMATWWRGQGIAARLLVIAVLPAALMFVAVTGTFYLTDFLVRHFDRLVIAGLGIDRHPELAGEYFQLPPGGGRLARFMCGVFPVKPQWRAALAASIAFLGDRLWRQRGPSAAPGYPTDAGQRRSADLASNRWRPSRW